MQNIDSNNKYHESSKLKTNRHMSSLEKRVFELELELKNQKLIAYAKQRYLTFTQQQQKHSFVHRYLHLLKLSLK